MHQIIENILSMDKEMAKDKIAALKEDILIAEKILDGDISYCKICKDYFLTCSFLQESKTIEGQVCTYVDPVNSSENRYAPGYITYTYLVCPKGHRHLMKTDGREKL